MIDIQLSGFEMLSKLGQGGMATVWKARQISLDRTVAIKILSSSFASDPADIQRFQQEAQSAAKLKHPGIVQVYDANIENGFYFFVMEFVDGYTCADWLKRKERLSEKDVLLIAECVADSLGYAWDREKMIHCDIKPDNIMIDEDGTVKVTDLGLSRTISGMNVDEESEEILGTPAYMAPEQAMGEANQDCRLDMYALGAMMYHLSTGRLLFPDVSESEVMELQITDTVENPKDLNPSLSKGFCRLVEVLMAKDKEHRPSDWAAVQEAIARVKKGLSPRIRLSQDAVSTVRKSVSAEEHAVSSSALGAHTPSLSTEQKKRGVLPFIAGAAFLVLLVIVAGKLLLDKQKPSRTGRRTVNVTGNASGGESGSSSAEEQGRRLYYRASNWEKSHRGDYDKAIEFYQEVVSQATATKYADRASRDISRLEKARKKDHLEGVFRNLNAEARPWIAQHQFDRAIRIFDEYSGDFAAETQSERMDIVSKLKADKAAWEREQEERRKAEIEARFDAKIKELSELALKGEFAKAAASLESFAEAKEFQDRYDDLYELKTVLGRAAAIDSRILESFNDQKNTEIVVQLAEGPKRLRISDVKGNLVLAGEVFKVGAATASRANNFGVDDLSIAEKFSRMGMDSELDVALVKGVMAYQSRAFTHARRYFEMTHPLLVPPLLAALEQDSANVVREAENDLSSILKTAGMGGSVGFEDINGLTSQVAALKVTHDKVLEIKPLAEAFRRKHQRTPFCRKVGPVIDALLSLQGVEPHEVVQRQPERKPLDEEEIESAKNIDAVIEALIRSNPGLGSEAIRFRKDDRGVVTYLEIRCTPDVFRSLAGVESLKGLRSLRTIHWGRDIAPLADLSPLQGLSLESLSLDSCSVSGIEIFEGMPLRELRIPNCPVRDLKPIKDAPLKVLDLSGTKVYDFLPLRQMSLTHFEASNSQLKTLDCLRDMEIDTLIINNTKVFNFSLLSQMPLKEFRASGTQIRSLTSLRRCPLVIFEANGSNVSDFSPLLDCAGTLRELHLNGTTIKSFIPLKRLNLTSLSLGNTAFSDATLIQHMELTHLDIKGSRVTSIDAVDSRNLTYLNIENTDISSISVLDGSPVEILYCRGSKVRNFRPVHGSAVERLTVDRPGSKWSLYEQLPKLKTVNGRNINDDPPF